MPGTIATTSVMKAANHLSFEAIEGLVCVLLRPIRLSEACERYDVSMPVAQRWMDDRKMWILGSCTYPSGQKGVLVDENQFRKLAANRRTGQVTTRFYRNASAAGCAPLFALGKICSTRDVDLTFAAMHLALDSTSHFFDFLKRPAAADPRGNISFAAAVAQLLGTNEEFRYGHSLPEEESHAFSLFEFRRQFAARKTRYCLQFRPERNLVDEMRPRYLAQIQCASIPEWAQKPVWPIRQAPENKQIMQTLKNAAAKDSTLAEHLEKYLHKSLREMPPAYNPAVRQQEGDLRLREEIKILAKNMAVFGLDENLAEKYCHAYSRLIHHDIYRHNKQKHEARDPNVPYRPEKIPTLIVNRIFGAKS